MWIFNDGEINFAQNLYKLDLCLQWDFHIEHGYVIFETRPIPLRLILFMTKN